MYASSSFGHPPSVLLLLLLIILLNDKGNDNSPPSHCTVRTVRASSCAAAPPNGSYRRAAIAHRPSHITHRSSPITSHRTNREAGASACRATGDGRCFDGRRSRNGLPPPPRTPGDTPRVLWAFLPRALPACLSASLSTAVLHAGHTLSCFCIVRSSCHHLTEDFIRGTGLVGRADGRPRRAVPSAHFPPGPGWPGGLQGALERRPAPPFTLTWSIIQYIIANPWIFPGRSIPPNRSSSAAK